MKGKARPRASAGNRRQSGYATVPHLVHPLQNDCQDESCSVDRAHLTSSKARAAFLSDSLVTTEQYFLSWLLLPCSLALHTSSPGEWAGVTEFYKKECQEKSSASTGVKVLFLEIQPTFHRLRCRGF